MGHLGRFKPKDTGQTGERFCLRYFYGGSSWFWQAALQKRDRAEMDGEERERKLLEDQITRARAAHGDTVNDDAGLQKKEGEKISLNLFDSAKSEEDIKLEPGIPDETIAGPSQISQLDRSEPKHSTMPISFSTTGTAASLSTQSANPLKRPAPLNVCKQSKSIKTESDAGTAKKGYMSEAERLMKEDQARKMRGGPGGYSGFGPKRETGGAAPRRFVLQ